jgi:Copper transport outer membrane protein, MctB
MRRHLVVLFALVFALAAGIALGAGPLSVAQPTRIASPAEPRDDVAPADPRALYADTLAAALASRAYAGGLAERSIAILRLPGVPDETIGALHEQVRAAGGTISAQYAIGSRFLEPGEKSLVDTLGSQLAQQLTELTVPADATAYDRLGALVGEMLATTERNGAALAAEAPTVSQSLEAADLIHPELGAGTRAPLVLVVLGEEAMETSDPAVAGLLRGLAGTARGVVLAAAAASAVDGTMARLRAEDLGVVTTVDGIDGAAGLMTATLALARALSQTGGAFGASGADGAVPMG